MQSCKRCTKRVATVSFCCAVCKGTFYPGCARRYVVNKPSDDCCLRSVNAANLAGDEIDNVQASTESLATVLGLGVTASQVANSTTGVSSNFNYGKRYRSPPLSATLPPAKLHCPEVESLSSEDSAESPTPSLSLQASPPRSAAVISANMGDQAPRWFMDFWIAYRNDKAKIDQLLTDMGTRMNTLETKLEKVTTEKSKEIQDLRNDLSSYVRESDERDAMEDMAEITVTGIPASISCDPRQAVGRVFAAIGVASIANHITDVREWQKNSAEQQGATATLVEPPTLAFVVRLCSPSNRSTVLAKAHLLDKLSLKDIFGCTDVGKIDISSLYPRPVYRLCKEARRIAKNLGYAPPLVRNLVVFMRQTRDAPLIAVHSEGDLAALAPHRNSA